MLRTLSKFFPSKKIIFRSYVSGEPNQITEAKEKKYIENNYDYILVLDFEATCNRPIKIVQEIIEFPCLKINSKTFEEESRFHHYVKPVLNPYLTDYCIKLTGIAQNLVENAYTFPKVLSLFEKWREAENITDNNSIYITSGDWDLGCMIPNQCKLTDLEVPQHMHKWIDIKKMYGNNFNEYYTSFAEIMKTFDLQFQGRMHSGIDDCVNMHSVVKVFGKLGLKFIQTSQLVKVNSGWKVHVIGAKKFEPPTIWSQRKAT